jgi:hypothetical protein
MDWQARTRDTVLVKSREMTGRTQTTTENKIHLPRCFKRTIDMHDVTHHITLQNTKVPTSTNEYQKACELVNTGLFEEIEKALSTSDVSTSKNKTCLNCLEFSNLFHRKQGYKRKITLYEMKFDRENPAKKPSLGKNPL